MTQWCAPTLNLIHTYNNNVYISDRPASLLVNSVWQNFECLFSKQVNFAITGYEHGNGYDVQFGRTRLDDILPGPG